MTFKTKITILFFAFLLFISLLSFLRTCSIINNFEVTYAYVIEVNGLNKSPGSVFIRYKYRVHGVLYVEYETLACSRWKADKIRECIGLKNIMIVYKKNDPGNSEMLLWESTFNRYKLKIPDEYRSSIDSIHAICTQD